MATRTLAMDRLIASVLNIGTENIAAGNYDQAVSLLTTTVEAVESDQSTRNAYNLRLLPVYALRALAFLKCAQAGAGDATLIHAQQDVLKAHELLYFMMYLTIEGCPWLSQYGPLTVGALVKYMLLCLLACTIVGLIPIGFWTGKKTLSWVGLF